MLLTNNKGEKVMEKFKTSRGLFLYIILSAITFGIYPLYYMHRVSYELNVTCAEDGKHTRGLIGVFLLSLITFGIYSIIWWYCAANRMEQYGYRNKAYGITINGIKYLLWNTFGTLLFGLGPLIAMYKFIHSHNIVNLSYNNK